MLNSQTNSRRQTVALLAVLNEGEGAADLLHFMNDGDKKACETKISTLIDSNNSDGLEDVRLKLNALIAAKQFSGIAEIHPAWILEELKYESPRIIGIIMRYLPSKQVRYILKNLPPEIRDRIPNLVEAFAVPEAILDVIKKRFESRFLPIHISKTQDNFSFEHLYYLKSDELEVLLSELGLCEMALALDGLSDKFLQVVLNRLSLKDAKRLHKYIKKMGGYSREIKQQARFAVLETGDDVCSENLLVEIGLGSLARAMNPKDEELYLLMRQKMSPKIAYVLKRFIDERASCNSQVSVDERRKLVLSCIAELAGEMRIDGQWAKFSSQ